MRQVAGRALLAGLPLLGGFSTGTAVLPAAVALPSPSASRSPAPREIRFDDTPFADALAVVRDLAGVNLHVDWPTLRQVGVTEQTPVTLRVRPRDAAQLLRLVLDAAAGAGTLTWTAEANVLRVTTLEAADARLVVRVYDVRDLVRAVPDFPAPRQSIGLRRESNGGRPPTARGDVIIETDAERGRRLIDLITTTLRPDVWQTNGGPASIRYTAGRLVVAAPRSVHAALGRQ